MPATLLRGPQYSLWTAYCVSQDGIRPLLVIEQRCMHGWLNIAQGDVRAVHCCTAVDHMKLLVVVLRPLLGFQRRRVPDESLVVKDDRLRDTTYTLACSGLRDVVVGEGAELEAVCKMLKEYGKLILCRLRWIAANY